MSAFHLTKKVPHNPQMKRQGPSQNIHLPGFQIWQRLISREGKIYSTFKITPLAGDIGADGVGLTSDLTCWEIEVLGQFPLDLPVEPRPGPIVDSAASSWYSNCKDQAW